MIGLQAVIWIASGDFEKLSENPSNKDAVSLLKTIQKVRKESREAFEKDALIKKVSEKKVEKSAQ
jgi:hypothetical protein